MIIKVLIIKFNLTIFIKKKEREVYAFFKALLILKLIVV